MQAGPQEKHVAMRRLLREIRTKRLVRRDLLMFGISFVCMALLGDAAMLTQWIKDGWLTTWWVPLDAFPTLLLCAVIGGSVGLLSWPCVSLCLSSKDLRIAVPVVYGVSLFVVVVYTFTGATGTFGILSAAIPAFLSVCLCSVAVRLALPNRVHDVGHCPQCGYDLRVSLERGCPECGWRRESMRR